MKTVHQEELIPYLYEGVYVVDQDRKIIFWNEGSTRITGYRSDEVLHRFCHHNLLQHVDASGKQLCLNGCPLHNTLQTGVINEAHVFLRHKEGYRIPVMVRSIPIYDTEQKIVAAIEVFTDERFQKQMFHENESLKNELRTDPLTRVANRNYFNFQMTSRLEEAHQFNTTFGVLLIDIDRFKNVNDTYGHLVGDEVLKLVANSLSSNVEPSELVSRWGGEEFVAIINADSDESLFEKAETLRNLVSASSHTMKNGEVLKVTVSIGGTLFKNEDTLSSMIERADQNMYYAKQHGRNMSRIT